MIPFLTYEVYLNNFLIITSFVLLVLITLAVIYISYVSWIDKNHMNILKEQSFNRKNKLEKEKHFNYETRGEYQLIKKLNVENLLKKHATEITFSEIVINSGISDKLFQEMSLRRLPLD